MAVLVAGANKRHRAGTKSLASAIVITEALQGESSRENDGRYEVL
jgi:hypothetical protein